MLCLNGRNIYDGVFVFCPRVCYYIDNMEEVLSTPPALANKPKLQEEEKKVETKGEYDLHIRVPEEMRLKLKDLADLAYKMEMINKPDLVDLMNLFIGWGFAILKKQWLEKVGYK